MAEITTELLARLSEATLKVIKSYTLYPVNEFEYKITPTGTEWNIDFDAVGTGKLMVITSIAGIPVTAAGDAIKIGVVNGGTPYWHKVDQAPAADTSTVFSGQLILAEAEFIRVRFEYTSAPDSLEAYVNGYWIYV